MQALAQVLLDWGWNLSGSDRTPQRDQVLRTGRMPLFAGHAPENLPDAADILIYSRATEPANVERREALQRNLPQCSYAQMLGSLMRSRRGIAVAGTHGKSTTTAMLGEILLAAGLDPSVVCGAPASPGTAGSRGGKGEWLVAEACEYRQSFLELSPQVLTLLNIEPDHFDCFPERQLLDQAFARLIGSLPPDGSLVANIDAPGVRDIVQTASLPKNVATISTERPARWQAGDIQETTPGFFQFSLLREGKHLAALELSVPGRHQVNNALAAAATALECGVPVAAVRAGLANFRGLERRLEFRGTLGSQGAANPLWDDYAHHPSEIQAARETLRRVHPERRLIGVFQPHQISRTRFLLDGFAESLQNFDVVLLADVYAAREPESSSASLLLELGRRIRRRGGQVSLVTHPRRIGQQIQSLTKPGDVVVTMGAGDLRWVSDELVGRFRKHCA